MLLFIYRCILDAPGAPPRHWGDPGFDRPCIGNSNSFQTRLTLTTGHLPWGWNQGVSKPSGQYDTLRRFKEFKGPSDR